MRDVYATLAMEQAFWPRALASSAGHPLRESIDPGTFHPGGAEMPWMWAPVKCARVRGVPSAALSDAAARLADRSDHALLGRRHTEAMREASRRLAAFAIGFVPFGNLAEISDLADDAQEATGVTRAFQRVRTTRRELRRAATESYMVPAGEVAHARLIEDLMGWMRALAREELPVILAIDDMRDSEQALLKLLDRLFTSELAVPVVCICTSTDDDKGPFSDWLTVAAARDPDRISRVHLEPLSHQAVERLASSVLPGADREIIAALAERAAGNPLVLRGLIADSSGTEDSDAPRVRWADVARAPNSHRGQFAARWDELSADQRIVLSIAALQGTTFSPRLLRTCVRVAAAEGLLGDARAVDSTLALSDWISESAPGWSFAESICFEIAVESMADRRRFSPGQIARICVAGSDAITAMKEDAAQWRTLAPDVRAWFLEIHVELHRHLSADEPGAVDVLSALDSALTLAPIRRRRTDASTSLGFLRRATALAEARVRDLPIAGAVHEQLGATLALVGRHSEARRERKAGFEARRASLGPENPTTLEAELQYAIAATRVGDFAAALTHVEHVLTARMSMAGDDDGTVSARVWLAWVLESLKRYAEALPHRAELLDRYLRVAGPAARDTLEARATHAVTSWQIDRAPSTVSILEEVLEQQCRQWGDHDFDVQATRAHLGRLYASLGRYEESASLRGRHVDVAAQLMGAGDELTLSSRMEYAWALDKLGSPDATDEWRQASRGYRRLLASASRDVGSEDPEVAPVIVHLRAGLAECLEGLGDADDAIDLRRRNAELLTRLAVRSHEAGWSTCFENLERVLEKDRADA